MGAVWSRLSGKTFHCLKYDDWINLSYAVSGWDSRTQNWWQAKYFAEYPSFTLQMSLWTKIRLSCHSVIEGILNKSDENETLSSAYMYSDWIIWGKRRKRLCTCKGSITHNQLIKWWCWFSISFVWQNVLKNRKRFKWSDGLLNQWEMHLASLTHTIERKNNTFFPLSKSFIAVNSLYKLFSVIMFTWKSMTLVFQLHHPPFIRKVDKTFSCFAKVATNMLVNHLYTGTCGVPITVYQC